VTRLVRINGELAEVIPAGAGRAQLVYLAGQPEDRLPTEVEYAPLKLEGRFRRERVTLKSPDVLLVERVEPDVRHALDPRHLVNQPPAEVHPQAGP
jgi:hypothetical protein